MILKPKNKCIKCFTKYENVLPDPPVYAKLLAAEYTGKNENTANNVDIAQINRSPFMFLKNVCMPSSDD